MKILALALIIVLLATGFVSAVEDSEILQFARGAVATSIMDTAVVSIENDTLIGRYSLNEYDSRDPGYIVAQADWLMDTLLKVIKVYPDRFSGAYATAMDGQKQRAAVIWLK